MMCAAWCGMRSTSPAARRSPSPSSTRRWARISLPRQQGLLTVLLSCFESLRRCGHTYAPSATCQWEGIKACLMCWPVGTRPPKLASSACHRRTSRWTWALDRRSPSEAATARLVQEGCLVRWQLSGAAWHPHAPLGSLQRSGGGPACAGVQLLRLRSASETLI